MFQVDVGNGNRTADYTQTENCPTEALDADGDPILLTMVRASFRAVFGLLFRLSLCDAWLLVLLRALFASPALCAALSAALRMAAACLGPLRFVSLGSSRSDPFSCAALQTGTNFGPEVIVTVGGNPCYNVRPVAGAPVDKKMTCQLPPGVGLGRNVRACRLLPFACVHAIWMT